MAIRLWCLDEYADCPIEFGQNTWGPRVDASVRILKLSTNAAIRRVILRPLYGHSIVMR